jgi:hypothetical protein
VVVWGGVGWGRSGGAGDVGCGRSVGLG